MKRLIGLKVGQKLGLSFLILSLPVIFLGYAFVDEKLTKISNTTLEITAIQQIVPLKRFASHIAQHRGMTSQ